VIRIWLFFVLVLAGLCGVAWATDFITPQGERTVYTAECERGTWQGAHCTGTLVAGAAEGGRLGRQRRRPRLSPPRGVVGWASAHGT